MGKFEKEKNRLKSKPKDYTYSEAKTLLAKMGFAEYNKGKTSGSRVKFYRESDGRMILLHKPHPGDVMKSAAVKQLYKQLTELGEL
ncbi:MAG: type II toxin-antitoxin system HicA family toxin [Peptococcaceae bacterium]|nr:type II toxin-antitoxin system HicA family toxin [Peptococcaceae bacterium]